MLTIRKLDTPTARKIERKLKENDGYCPCSLVRNESTKCMCEDFRNSESLGTCHCGLYEKFDPDAEREEKELTVPLSKLEKIVETVKEKAEGNDINISFTFLVGSCFPHAAAAIDAKLLEEYSKGFSEGLKAGHPKI